MHTMKCKYLCLLAIVGFAAGLLYAPSTALAAAAPPPGAVQRFGVLAASGVTAAGPAGTVVTGDVGSSPIPSITGFPPALVDPAFTLHTTNDSVVQQAQIDATAAFASLNQACDQFLTGLDLGTIGTLGPGVYCFSSTAGLTGTLTLNGPGVYIFQIGSSITTAGGSNVAVSNGADSCNVFWRVGSSATLGASSTFRGTILAGASIGLGTTANLVGRAVAQTGVVTMDGSNTVGGCSAPAPVPPPGGVTLSKAFFPTTINAGGVSTFTITLSNANTSAVTLTAPLGGSYLNTLADNALQTGNGNNAATANATLTVTAAAVVPTLSGWAMIMLYSSLGPVFGFAAMPVITCAPARAMKA